MPCVGAYNRWVIDFCSGSNGRLVPIAHCFLGDPKVAAEDLTAAVKAGAKGAMIVTFNIRRLPLGDTEWDPFYAAAQDLDVPICIHVSGELREYRPFTRIQPKILHDGGQFLMSVLGGRVAMEIALVDMFQYGLFERFPRLRVGFFEGGAGWVPSLLDKMEAVFDTQVGERSIKRTARPKETFAQQCFVSGDPDETGWAKNNRRLRPQSIRLGVGFSASRPPRKLHGASCSPRREPPHTGSPQRPVRGCFGPVFRAGLRTSTARIRRQTAALADFCQKNALSLGIVILLRNFMAKRSFPTDGPLRLYYHHTSSASMRVTLYLRCRGVPSSQVTLVSTGFGTDERGIPVYTMPENDPETERLGTTDLKAFNPEGARTRPVAAGRKKDDAIGSDHRTDRRLVRP